MFSDNTDSSIGLVGDGSTPNLARFSTWASNLSGPARLKLGPGRYLFEAAPIVNFPNPAIGPQCTTAICPIVIEGAGPDLTEILFTASPGPTFNYSSQQHALHLSGVAVTTSQANGGNAITLNQSYGWFGTWNARSTIRNCVFRGSDGYALRNYWGTCIKNNGVSNIGFNEIGMYGNSDGNVGTGIDMASPGSGNFSTKFDFEAIEGNFLGLGFKFGQNIQSVSIAKTALFNGQTGLWIPPGCTGLQDLVVSDSRIMTLGAPIQMDSPFPNYSLHDLLILIGAGQWGIRFNQNGGGTIRGVQMAPGDYPTAPGAPAGGILVGNTVAGTTTAIAGGNKFESVGIPILLGTGSSRVNVQSNTYTGNTTGVQNYGTLNIVGGGSQ